MKTIDGEIETMIAISQLIMLILIAQQVPDTAGKIGDAEMQKRIVKSTVCALPEVAVTARIASTVVLEIAVDDKGQVGSITVIKGHRLLHASAVSCVKQWKFLATGKKYRGQVVAKFGTRSMIGNCF